MELSAENPELGDVIDRRVVGVYRSYREALSAAERAIEELEALGYSRLSYNIARAGRLAGP